MYIYSMCMPSSCAQSHSFENREREWGMDEKWRRNIEVINYSSHQIIKIAHRYENIWKLYKARNSRVERGEYESSVKKFFLQNL
jgi:hypothetical protein